MTSIEPYTFQHLPDLEWLSLENNSIEHIEPAAFNNLYKLERLQLQGNMLYDFLIEHSCLKVLDLSNNKLKSVPSVTTRDQYSTERNISVVNLNLSNNDIAKADYEDFKGMANIRSLDLAGNKIDMHLEVFSICMPNLMQLQICDWCVFRSSNSSSLQTLEEACADGHLVNISVTKRSPSQTEWN
jgi:Leucine-rich repeat (LRR) protein